MIKETEHYSLEQIRILGAQQVEIDAPISNGLKIVQKLVDGTTSLILYILPNTDGTCYIRTYKDAFQTSVSTWELYTEIMQLIDAGFDAVSAAINMAMVQQTYQDYFKD